MKESHAYLGHSIDLDLSEITGDVARWTYFIDDSYCIQGATASTSIEAVRADALALAHRSIDILDSMRSGTGRRAGLVRDEPGSREHDEGPSPAHRGGSLHGLTVPATSSASHASSLRVGSAMCIGEQTRR